MGDGWEMVHRTSLIMVYFELISATQVPYFRRVFSAVQNDSALLFCNRLERAKPSYP
jgi:hypothetical protein